MFRYSAPLLSCLILSGCASVAPSRVSEVKTTNDRPSSQLREVDPDIVADLPPGARVEIISGPTDKIVGTVLHASADGIALLNCEQTYGHENDPMVFHRHIPVHWTSIRLIVSARILSQPPEDYVAPRLEIDTNDGIDEVDTLGQHRGL